MSKVLPVAIICLAVGIAAALVVGCGALGLIGSSANENANKKTCQAGMKVVQTRSNVYAASHDGAYPGSLEDLAGYLELVGYLENPNVTCPSGGTITWNFSGGQDGRPPSPSCSKHGTVSR